MPRTNFAAGMLPLFAVLAVALSLPGKAVAGPPEGVSGKMVFDEVAEGLRRYAAWDGGEFVGRTRAIDWWQKNKADLRRHAKQLPQ